MDSKCLTRRLSNSTARWRNIFKVCWNCIFIHLQWLKVLHIADRVTMKITKSVVIFQIKFVSHPSASTRVAWNQKVSAVLLSILQFSFEKFQAMFWTFRDLSQLPYTYIYMFWRPLQYYQHFFSLRWTLVKCNNYSGR